MPQRPRQKELRGQFRLAILLRGDRLEHLRFLNKEICARLNGQLNLVPVNEETAIEVGKEFEE